MFPVPDHASGFGHTAGLTTRGNGGFLEWGYAKLDAYNGSSPSKKMDDFESTPISGNLQMWKTYGCPSKNLSELRWVFYISVDMGIGAFLVIFFGHMTYVKSSRLGPTRNRTKDQIG